jgi:GT2 family glycosyltransferase
MIEVSIIMVNYNTRQLTKNSIDSIFEKTNDLSFEVILVDNSSSDGSVELFKDDSRVTFVESGANIGFGGGNNLGAQYANGRFLLFLNPDTLLKNNAIKILADFLKTTPQAGICGGNLYDGNGCPTHSYYILLPSIFWEFFGRFRKIPLSLIYGKSQEFNYSKFIRQVGMITGADLMIRKDIFEKIGGFDSDFFAYSEDTELNYKVKKVGYKIYNVPQAEIIHLEGQSFSKNKKKKNENRLNGRKLYYKKTHSRFYNIIALSIIDFYEFLKKIVNA